MVIATIRGDVAGAHTLDSAFDKAYTAASFKNDTLALVARTKGEDSIAPLARLPHVMFFGGGVPIKLGDETLARSAPPALPAPSSTTPALALGSTRSRIACSSPRRRAKSATSMQAFADVQALVFDVFGTVVDWRSGVARESAAFLTRYAPGADPAAFADAWRRRYSPAMEEIRSGRRPFVRLDVLHRENLEAVLPEFGIDPASVRPSELDALNLAWHRLDPWPDSVPGLTRLKRRFIIAPLSNGNIRLMLDMAKRAGCLGTPFWALKSPKLTSRARRPICAPPRP